VAGVVAAADGGVAGAGWFLGGLAPRHIPAMTTSQCDAPRVGSLRGGGDPRRTRGGEAEVVPYGVDALPSLVDVDPLLVPDDPGVEVSTRIVTLLSPVDPSMLRHSPAFLSACEQSANAGMSDIPTG
jgi:hypothetical protein